MELHTLDTQRYITEMPLAMVKEGNRVLVKDVSAGIGTRMRLAAMGVLPGCELQVVRNHMDGPLIVQVIESRVVLGREMAQKIDVA
jgi:Fe2+ transport system protein FeoA